MDTTTSGEFQTNCEAENNSMDDRRTSSFIFKLPQSSIIRAADSSLASRGRP